MNAEKARRETAAAKKTKVSKRFQALKKAEGEEDAARKRGRRVAKRKYLPSVHADIEKATKAGERKVVSFMSPGMFGPSDSPMSVAFFSGVIERLGEILFREGYKVQTSINRNQYEPRGSDPICNYPISYIDPKVEVEW